MVEEAGAKTGLGEWAMQLLATLEAAHQSLRDGDAAAAERAGKAVSALVKALREVHELEAHAQSQQPEENEEELRAELERRIARYLDADRAADLLAEVESE